MALKELEESIRNSGLGELREIRRRAEEKIKEIEKEIDEEVERAYQMVKERRKQQLTMAPRRIVSDARMQRNRELDMLKANTIQKAFDEAREKILNSTEEEKRELLKKFISNGRAKIKNPVIYIDKKYMSLVKGATTKELDDFGVLVESRDSSVSIDYTLSAIMEKLKAQLGVEVANILFPKR